MLSLLVPLFVALMLAGPATAVLLWLLLWLREQQYKAALDRALPAAVGRLGTRLRSGRGIQPALEKVVADLPDSPFKAEWSYIIDHFGAPLPGGSLATPQQVVAALVAQTPSPRHPTLLEHMEVALGQTHDVLIKRVQAAYGALHAAEQRRQLPPRRSWRRCVTAVSQSVWPAWAWQLSGADPVEALHAGLPRADRIDRWTNRRHSTDHALHRRGAAFAQSDLDY